ncbi:MAG: DUF550 domain-containing protein [Kiritimatiellae bacterium]|nr:DUF550 domain-containing protein [Kiritimatiellia bacterium]MDD5521368.1 DUF550 domain-containing protein [Kiritimatiellia bacterium]
MEEILQKSVDKLHDIFDRSDLDAEWKKLQHKFEEAKYNPGDVTPLADCIFSILLAARSRGFKVSAVMQALEKVAENNLKRKWKKMADGTYQAI